jgi:hypothetical protein
MNEQDKRIIEEAEEFEAMREAEEEAKPYDDEQSLRRVGMSYKDFI